MVNTRQQAMDELAAGIKARLTAGESAASITASITASLDEVVREAFVRSFPAERREALLVLAVGGFGRREMFPHGDMDVVVLYDDGACAPDAPPGERLDAAVPGAAEAVGTAITGLRDAGYRVALRIRGVEEHLRLVGEDVTVAAASLDARPLMGPQALLPDPSEATCRAIRERFGGGQDRFCALILEGVRHRHGQFGGSAWLLEPQLKTGRGGLRDGHAIQWAARLRWGTAAVDLLARRGVVSTPEADDFRAAYAFVARARLALHTLSRWRNDRLAFERQEDVARLMGFGHGEGPEAIEAFMQAYYRHAEQLANLCERWLQEWTEDTAPGAVEPLDDGFELRGERLALSDGDAPREIEEASRLLLRARALGVQLHASARSFLRDVADTVEPRVALHPEAVRLLRGAVLTPAPDAYLLRVLLDIGLFARLVPEWRHIVGHTSHDVYHVYTTDRHLFVAFTRIAALVNGVADEAPAFVVEALQHLENQSHTHVQALLVSGLLHDVGKGMDGDHSLIGAGMVHEIARRMALPPDGRELARWLVLEHLRMVRMSQRRDLTDPETLLAFLAQVPSEIHLNALTVLSWADMTSVGPGLQVTWKLELLRQLHQLARAHLAGRPPAIPRLRHRPPVTDAVARGALDEDELRWLENELPDRHWASFSDAELADAVAVLRTARRQPDPAMVRFEHDVAPGVSRLLVCTRDRSGLLYALTATIASERHNILRARIFTTASGLALDLFDLPWADPGGRPLGERRRERLVEKVTLVARDAIDPDALQPARDGESTLARPHRPPVPTEILVEPSGGDGPMLIEVKTRDRVGLLAVIAGRLSELGFAIERAIIAREGDRAIDTFYVLRTPGAHLGADELSIDLRELLRDLDERADHPR